MARVLPGAGRAGTARVCAHGGETLQRTDSVAGACMHCSVRRTAGEYLVDVREPDGRAARLVGARAVGVVRGHY